MPSDVRVLRRNMLEQNVRERKNIREIERGRRHFFPSVSHIRHDGFEVCPSSNGLYVVNPVTTSLVVLIEL